MTTTDYWEKEYLKAKADNVALHKGIRRLKKREEELLGRVSDAVFERRRGEYGVSLAQRMVLSITGVPLSEWFGLSLDPDDLAWLAYVHIKSHPAVVAKLMAMTTLEEYKCDVKQEPRSGERSVSGEESDNA